MTLDTPPMRFSVEAGYDANGTFVYDQLMLGAVGDPLTQNVDEVRRVRVQDGVLVMYDAQGLPLYGEDAPPTLQSMFGASPSDPLVITDGLVIQSPPPVSSQVQASDGSTSTVTGVQSSGSGFTVSTVVRSSDPSVPDVPQRRTYVAVGSEYVLSVVETDIATQTPGMQIAGRSTVRLENVSWNRNAARDNRRRDSSDTRPWGQLQSPSGTNSDPFQEPCEDSGDLSDDRDTRLDIPECNNGGGGGGNGAQSCPLTSGGADLVYVHGILADGAAWGDPSLVTTGSKGVLGPVRCALAVGSDAAPSLTRGGDKGLGRHTEQASQLYEQVQTVGDPIFVGHSQGGLISRSGREGSAGAGRGGPGRRHDGDAAPGGPDCEHDRFQCLSHWGRRRTVSGERVVSARLLQGGVREGRLVPGPPGPSVCVARHIGSEAEQRRDCRAPRRPRPFPQLRHPERNPPAVGLRAGRRRLREQLG